MQQGRYAAKVVRARLAGDERPPFHYHDKGNLATIGRGAAVADIKGLQLSGFLAWVTWLVVHLWYLVGFRIGCWSTRNGRSASSPRAAARLITQQEGAEPHERDGG